MKVLYMTFDPISCSNWLKLFLPPGCSRESQLYSGLKQVKYFIVGFRASACQHYVNHRDILLVHSLQLNSTFQFPPVNPAAKTRLFHEDPHLIYWLNSSNQSARFPSNIQAELSVFPNWIWFQRIQYSNITDLRSLGLVNLMTLKESTHSINS